MVSACLRPAQLARCGRQGLAHRLPVVVSSGPAFHSGDAELTTTTGGWKRFAPLQPATWCARQGSARARLVCTRAEERGTSTSTGR